MKRLWLPLMLTAWLVGPAAAAPTPTPSPSPSPAARPSESPAGPYIPKVRGLQAPPELKLPPPTLPVPEGAQVPLTADQAARIALVHQSDIQVAAANLDAAGGRTDQARSGQRPHLSVTGSGAASLLNSGAGAFSTGVGGGAGATAGGLGFIGGANSNYAIGASLSQLLTDFGHTSSTVRQTEELESAAGAELTRTQSDLVLEVKKAFYLLVQNERLVKVNESNLSNQQEHLRLAQGRFDSGLGLPADVTRADTAVNEAILNLTEARNNARLARVNLALLMGLDPRTPLTASETSEPEVEVPDAERLFQLAGENRPEIAAALANIRAGQAAVTAAETTSSPALSAALSYNRRGQSNFELDTFFLTLNIAFQPYDGGLTAGKVREAEANLKAAQARLDGVQRRVLSDVARAYLDLKTAEQRLEAARAGVLDARETLRLADGRYRGGLGIFLDVLDAQAALVRAETSEVNAISARYQSRASLAHAVGLALRLLELEPAPPAPRVKQ